MSASIANEKNVIELAKTLTSRIPELALSDPEHRWTRAVFEAFREIAGSKGWTHYPEHRPYKGEYHLDFVLWEEGYGPRIVCESQWLHRFGQLEAIDWAFDKLRGVKGDIKILIYEWGGELDPSQPAAEVRQVLLRYLESFALLSIDEAFLFIDITDKGQWAYWWQPATSGRQNGIQFKPIALK